MKFKNLCAVITAVAILAILGGAVLCQLGMGGPIAACLFFGGAFAIITCPLFCAMFDDTI